MPHVGDSRVNILKNCTMSNLEPPNRLINSICCDILLGASCAHCGVNFKIDVPKAPKTVMCPIPTCKGFNRITPLTENSVRVDIVAGKHSVCSVCVRVCTCVHVSVYACVCVGV